MLTTLSIIAYFITSTPQFNEAVEVARCESQLGKYTTNWEGSSAYGLYQFMPKTFNAYCKGDIKSNTDQARCFTEIYWKHKNWWKCSK